MGVSRYSHKVIIVIESEGEVMDLHDLTKFLQKAGIKAKYASPCTAQTDPIIEIEVNDEDVV